MADGFAARMAVSQEEAKRFQALLRAALRAEAVGTEWQVTSGGARMVGPGGDLVARVRWQTEPNPREDVSGTWVKLEAGIVSLRLARMGGQPVTRETLGRFGDHVQMASKWFYYPTPGGAAALVSEIPRGKGREELSAEAAPAWVEDFATWTLANLPPLLDAEAVYAWFMRVARDPAVRRGRPRYAAVYAKALGHLDDLEWLLELDGQREQEYLADPVRGPRPGFEPSRYDTGHQPWFCSSRRFAELLAGVPVGP